MKDFIPAEIKETAKCAESFVHFLINHVTTQDSKRNIIRKIESWPYILNLADKLQYGFHTPNRLIPEHLKISKCRQMVVSWILAGYGLWRILYFKNWNIPMISRIGEAASDGTPQSFGGKVEFIYEHLDDYLKQEDIKIQTRPAKVLNEKFGSGIHFYNSTDDSARGGSGTEAILDEFAYAEHASLLYSAISPSVSRIIMNSTFNGDDENQEYYKLWIQDDPLWVRIEIDYYENPEHTQKTYIEDCAKLGCDKQRIACELDRNPSASISGKIFSFEGNSNLVELNDAMIERDLENNCIFSGHDLGFGDGHAYVMGYLKDLLTFPRFYIFKDYYLTRQTPPEISLQFKKDLLLYAHKSELHVADPTGDNKQQDGSESMFKIFDRLYVHFMPGKNDPRAIINTIETMLLEKTLIIHPRCKKLIDAIIHAQYPTDISGRVKDYTKFVHNKYSHILMALGYVLMQVIGRVGRPVSTKPKKEVNAYGEPISV